MKFVNIDKSFFITITTLGTLLSSSIQRDTPILGGPSIGIDLGETYPCVAVIRNGIVETILDEFGNRVIPSIVAFLNEGIIVGEEAKTQASLYSKITIYSIKRLIGRNYDDKEVQTDKKLLPYDIIEIHGKPYIEVEIKGQKKFYSPEEISAMILKKLKSIAETYLGVEVQNAVITVPAYFNDSQRLSTRNAGIIAGLNVKIINEPTAALLAYGLGNKDKDTERNILVFDFGGVSLDVSLLTIEYGVFEVVSTYNSAHLGGEYFNNRILYYLVKKIKLVHNVDVSKDALALSKLNVEIEKAKRELSSMSQAIIEIDQLVEGVDLKQILTKSKFEEIIEDLLKKILKSVEQVIKESGLNKKEIHEILLVGGSTRIPKVQQMLRDYFDGKELKKEINPDEAVAYGAAIQANILAKESNIISCPILDINKLTLGIETVGGVLTKIITKHVYIPAKKSKIFTTYKDNQTAVSIKVYEGERLFAKDNRFLSEFELNGIPPAPRGSSKIEVTFELYDNYIMNISAVDTSTGIGKTIQVTIMPDIESLSKEDEESHDERDNVVEKGVESKQNTIKDKAKFKISGEYEETRLQAVIEQNEMIESGGEFDKEEYETHLYDIQNLIGHLLSNLFQQGHSFEVIRLGAY